MKRRTIAVVVAFLALGAPLIAQLQVKPEEEFMNAVDFARRFFNVGNYDAALTYCDKADSVFADQPGVLYNTALVLVRLGRYDDAQQRLDRYRLLHPSGRDIETVKSLQRDIQFALEMRRTEKQQSDYRAAFSRARFLYQSGQHREALDAFRDAERLYPNDPPLLINEALLYEESGNLEKAAELYKRYMNTASSSRAEYESRVFKLERDIVDSRTQMMCPFCGQKLQPGSRWCHRCWHGPYDTTEGSLNARACGAGVNTTRTFYDATSKVRSSDQLSCLYPGKSLTDFLQYHPNRRAAIRAARTSEGWSYSSEDALELRQADKKSELHLVQGAYLQSVEDLRTGEKYPFTAHITRDSIWLLDSEVFTTADQHFSKSYGYDGDGRLTHEQVAYDSIAGGHLITYDVAYTNGDSGPVAATIKGGYDGARPEGSPQVRWEVGITRTFDSAGRLSREELQVRSFQKTYTAKPYGAIGRELRQTYQSLRPNRPIDLRATGDVIGTAGTNRLVEPIDLRPLYTLSPALAIVLTDGVVRISVDYTYP